MKSTIPFVFCVFFLTGFVFGQENRSVVEVFNEKLAAMIDSDSGKAQNAQQDWQKFCFQIGAPGQETRKAEAVRLMIEALGNPETAKAHLWFIRQLGRLGDGTAVKVISSFLDVEDRLVRDEAVWALANIPDNEAGAILKTQLNKETETTKKTAIENALKYRNNLAAAAIPALEEIVKTLEGSDKTAWDYTLPKLAWLHDVKIGSLQNYKERFLELDPLAQILLLDALAAMRDRSALPLAVELTKSNDETKNEAKNEAKKLAGYRALGLLGDSSVLPLLTEKMGADGDLGNTVRDSFVRLNFNGADAAIMELYEKQTDLAVKSEFLDVLRKRQGTIAIPAFESGLASSSEGIRQRSIYALESIGEPTSIPVLISRYFREEKRELRDAIDRAVVRISSRYGDQDGRGEVFCDEIIKRNEKEQAELLPILGKIGGTAAQKLVTEFLANGNEELKNAAFKSLCNWSDASVADDLYKIAVLENDSRSPAATKAYLRVVTLRAERSVKDSLILFQKGMEVAKSVDDKQFLLTRIETARSIEVFRFAVLFLDDAELNQAACRAIVDMANDNGFYMKNRKEIDPVLDKVIAVSKDTKHVDRAKRYKERQ
ncbi:MAG: HEAT repeat domain-containing protein [Planctomycetaceae bacterium]|jgi:HEAT repeat protein|nr:HEAT repeat domain-containing protein [Planctomycetaceae bacterium]